MKMATTSAAETVGSYLDRTEVQHKVQVRRVEARTWHIVDVPERGDEFTVDRLSGELESEQTAVAVARDYLTQVARAAA